MQSSLSLSLSLSPSPSRSSSPSLCSSFPHSPSSLSGSLSTDWSINRPHCVLLSTRVNRQHKLLIITLLFSCFLCHSKNSLQKEKERRRDTQREREREREKESISLASSASWESGRDAWWSSFPLRGRQSNTHTNAASMLLFLLLFSYDRAEVSMVVHLFLTLPLIAAWMFLFVFLLFSPFSLWGLCVCISIPTEEGTSVNRLAI